MTTPAGSEDAGLVLSAEERLRDDLAVHVTCYAAGRCDGPQMLAGVLATVAARVEAARAEERERIAADIDEAPGFRRWIDDSRVVDKDVAIHIARTPTPAGDDERGGA